MRLVVLEQRSRVWQPLVLVGPVVRRTRRDHLLAELKVRQSATRHDVELDGGAQASGTARFLERDVELIVRELDAKGRPPRMQELRRGEKQGQSGGEENHNSRWVGDALRS